MHATQQRGASVPRVTLYVKDSDTPIWDRARALTSGSEDSLSSLVTEGLAEIVERRERLQRSENSMEPVELEGVDRFDEEKPRKLRFVGVVAAEDRNAVVYITRAKKIVVELVMPGPQPNQLAVYDDFEEFRASVEEGRDSAFDKATLTEIAEALGLEFFEELD